MRLRYKLIESLKNEKQRKELNKKRKIDYNYKISNKYLYFNCSSKFVRRTKRRTSHFKHMIYLKGRELKSVNQLMYLIFYGGFGISAGHCKQLIYQGYIKVNGDTVLNPYSNIPLGSVIENTDPTALISYYMQKYSSYVPVRRRKKYRISDLNLRELDKK
jgi:ribosomal protein S4